MSAGAAPTHVPRFVLDVLRFAVRGNLKILVGEISHHSIQGMGVNRGGGVTRDADADNPDLVILELNLIVLGIYLYRIQRRRRRYFGLPGFLSSISTIVTGLSETISAMCIPEAGLHLGSPAVQLSTTWWPSW